MSKSYRNTASFGKRIEHYLIGKMLKEGLDVYIPMIDDDGVDAVVKRKDGTFVEVQIKARSNDVKFGDAALFAAIYHPKVRENYLFVFYSERMDEMWIMTSQEFWDNSNVNKKEDSKNLGKRTIWINGKNTKLDKEHTKPQFTDFVATDFRKIDPQLYGK
ncbi:MAG: group I intron-associated PD-(D/E)XK endonuclease [Rikenellaceae bacterium]